MKFLLLLFCVNLGSGILQNGTGQQGGVNQFDTLFNTSGQDTGGQDTGVNLFGILFNAGGQDTGGQNTGVNLSDILFNTRGQHTGVGVTVEEINNMLNAIQSTPFLGIYGDSMQGECPSGQQSKRTRIQAMGFDLDLWSAVMCTFAVMTTGPDHYARLYNPGKTVPGVSIQTFYLPLYAHNTASFMTVPRTLNPTFFVTATLTGCDIFVATSGQNLNCPLVVIHTNACGTMTTDTNHQEAIAVLSIDICHQQPYQIQYRVASSEHRSIIEHGGYHYTTEYYETSQSGIFFGYTLGSRYTSITTVPPWMFCRKNGLTTAIACHNIA